MAVVGNCVLLLLVCFGLRTSFSDDTVHCDVLGSCLLPCSFSYGDDVVIHWIKMAGEVAVYAYYRNQNQLARQDPGFKGRTSLFNQEISRGNASLQLTGLKVQDQGRYKCYTSTVLGSKESFTELKVEAPVREVTIQHLGDQITCSSSGLYPEPTLTWSTGSPPSDLRPPDEPTKTQTGQLLYNISSSVTRPEGGADVVCSVSAGRSSRRATMFRTSSISGCRSETTISCVSLNAPMTGLVWRFNHSQIILEQRDPDAPYTVTDEWEELVKGVSESGSVTLTGLTTGRKGVYTCEVRTEQETYMNSTVLQSFHSCSASAGVIAGPIVAVLIVVILVVLLVVGFWWHKRKRSKKEDDRNQTQAKELERPLKENN
ncbi:uncharacterized protein V6R79_001269 [Siganus canaliculatus]